MSKRFGAVFAILILFVFVACSQQSTWQDQYDLGVRYLSDGNYEEAIIAFTAAIDIEPKLAKAYIGRGQAYVFFGDTEENLLAAHADYEEAIKLDDKNPEGYLGLADVYIRMGEYDKALEVLKDGLSKTNNDADIAAKISEMENGNINDSAGRVHRYSVYDGDGTLLHYYDYQYNVNGEEASITSYDSDGEKIDYVETQYDSQGNVISSYGFNEDDGTLFRIDYEYDSDGLEIEEIWYDKNGNVDSYCINEYENGLCISQKWFDKNNIIMEEDRLQYDSDGLLVRLENLSENYYETYEYDADGIMIAQKFYWDNQLRSYLEYLYDEDGNYLGYNEYSGSGELLRSERTNA